MSELPSSGRGRRHVDGEPVDVADQQVVERLLADQAHQVSPDSGGLYVGDVPAREVASGGSCEGGHAGDPDLLQAGAAVEPREAAEDGCSCTPPLCEWT